MLKIRLRRPGKGSKGRYHWKIVVIEEKRARDARFTAQIGYYDPSRNILSLETAQYETWIKKGAKPSETVASLFKRQKKMAAKPAEKA